MSRDEPSAIDADGLLRLARAAQRGDRAALAALLRALQDTIYRYALSQLGDPDAAAEATQETGLRMLKAIRRFEGRSRVTTWALGVALNVCREHRRRRPSNLDLDAIEAMAAGGPSAGAGVERVEDAARLRDALDQLPARQREAVVLRYFEQLSVADAAEAMGCTAGAVKASVWHALRRLRAALSAEEVLRE